MGVSKGNHFEEEFRKIKENLEELCRDIKALAVLLIDKAGQLITTAGNTSFLDIPSFATLSAADFAATSNLADLIGEYDFTTLFHQGKEKSIYVSLISDQVILAVIFTKETTLGLVRIKVRKVSKKLEGFFDKIFADIEGEYVGMIDDDFIGEAESELDSLFE
ncbi:MAG: roadblock/LC7 domain-containing protein [candidate division WOR-3 bacterium]|nr:roadblock/LC7 domain-containing protein [candidate division WOR-3 bacterium]